MRRKDREVTDQKEIEAILEEAKILHLGLYDEGYPYVVPLHYGYEFVEGKLTLWMHCAKEGHKLDLIRKDPHVCAQIDCRVEAVSGGDIPCKYGSLFASVIGRGTAEILEDEEEKIRGLQILMKYQTGRDFEFSPEMATGVEVIRIRIEELSAKARTV